MDRLRDLRRAQGWRQEDLAKKLSLTRQAVARYEAGERDPDPETLCKLCDIFGCTADYLLGRSDVPRFELSDAEWQLIASWRRASLRDRGLIDSILEAYAEPEEKGTAL